MTPINEFKTDDFSDFEFTTDADFECEICGKPKAYGDSLCEKCRNEYDTLYYAWVNASEGVKDKFKGEI